MEDGTIVLIRPVIVNVIETGPKYPTGPSFMTQNQIVVTVITPPELKEVVKDKPRPTGTNFWFNPDIWAIIPIKESTPGIDSVYYDCEDGRKYLIELEAYPDIISRTLEYKDEMGSPIYHIRYSTRLSVKLAD